MDIEESSRIIINDLIPKLLYSDISEKEILETPFNIGEELRHVIKLNSNFLVVDFYEEVKLALRIENRQIWTES